MERKNQTLQVVQTIHIPTFGTPMYSAPDKFSGDKEGEQQKRLMEDVVQNDDDASCCHKYNVHVH